MTRHTEMTARYGVDIEGASQHFEAENLTQIQASLVGRVGRVHVFDRLSGSLLFKGSADEVRTAVGTLTSLHSNSGYEMDGVA